MLNKKLLTSIALGLVSMPLFADSPMDIEWVTNNTILYALYALIVILILMVFMLGKTLNHLTAYFNKDEAPEQRRNFWEQLFQVKALSTDKDMMMDHEYDGIRELDNPPPPWFMFLFYGTILFAVIYFYRFQISGNGPTQAEEYQTEMNEAAAEEAAAKAAEPVDTGPEITASTVTVSNDPAVLSKGKLVYNTKCKVCHSDAGKGLVGPNLTDEFWLHGGSIKDIYTTVENGVPPLMTPFKDQLKGAEISAVANYILSLDYISPDEGGKEPQGDKYDASAEEAAPAADEAASDTTETNTDAEASASE